MTSDDITKLCEKLHAMLNENNTQKPVITPPPIKREPPPRIPAPGSRSPYPLSPMLESRLKDLQDQINSIRADTMRMEQSEDDVEGRMEELEAHNDSILGRILTRLEKLENSVYVSGGPGIVADMHSKNGLYFNIDSTAKKHGMNPSTLRQRLARGMSLDKALVEPVIKRRTKTKKPQPIWLKNYQDKQRAEKQKRQQISAPESTK